LIDISKKAYAFWCHVFQPCDFDRAEFSAPAFSVAPCSTVMVDKGNWWIIYHGELAATNIGLHSPGGQLMA